jgi:phosphatidylglycerol:prolipoprotein diacylglycerol transferase
MYPNIIIGKIDIQSWYFFLFIGIIVPLVLAVLFKPKNFPLDKSDILFLCITVAVLGLIGARLLAVLLNIGKAGVKGGYAYFGALIFSIVTFYTYAALKQVKFLQLIDYFIPFMMLSQAFVRIGCFMAGCCYGRAAGACFGVVFKAVDKVHRHPTQLYEAALLALIYFVTRSVYKRYVKKEGVTIYSALILYGSGRFLIEFLRTDSPEVFMGLTLAHVACIAITLVTVLTFFTLNYSSLRRGK